MEWVNPEIEAYLAIYCHSHPDPGKSLFQHRNLLTITEDMLIDLKPHLNQ